jgi:hypothetical protein
MALSKHGRWPTTGGWSPNVGSPQGRPAGMLASAAGGIFCTGRESYCERSTPHIIKGETIMSTAPSHPIALTHRAQDPASSPCGPQGSRGLDISPGKTA